jgi:uncharacterized membrane protein
MNRFLAIVLALYGFQLSKNSTDTIRRLQDEAAHGNRAAASHFTQTHYARALGPRNSDLGMLFYGGLGAAAATNVARRPLILRLLFYSSSLSVGVSVYLLWALIFRLRVVCPICLRGHATNLAVFALLVHMRRKSR